MLKAPEGGTLELKKPLSTRTVRILIKIFSDRINILGTINRENSIHNPNWLLGQPNFSQDESDKLNRLLKRFGLKLANRYANVNSLLCYREVDLHDDTAIPLGNGKKMKVNDCSFVFIPLYGHAGAKFSIGECDNKKVLPIQDGSAIVLDHNTKHEVIFPIGNTKLKYGLSFLVDKVITQSPPSA